MPLSVLVVTHFSLIILVLNSAMVLDIAMAFTHPSIQPPLIIVCNMLIHWRFQIFAAYPCVFREALFHQQLWSERLVADHLTKIAAFQTSGYNQGE